MKIFHDTSGLFWNQSAAWNWEVHAISELEIRTLLISHVHIDGWQQLNLSKRWSMLLLLIYHYYICIPGIHIYIYTYLFISVIYLFIYLFIYLSIYFYIQMYIHIFFIFALSVDSWCVASLIKWKPRTSIRQARGPPEKRWCPIVR